MGAISYCYRCAVSVRDKDFERGKAVRAGDRVACGKCAREEGLEPAPAPPKPSPASTRLARAAPRPEPMAAEEPDEAPRSLQGPLLAAAAGGGVVVTGLLIWLAVRPGAPAPFSPQPPTPVVPETRRAEPREEKKATLSPEEQARKALDAALALGKAEPRAFGKRLKVLQEVVWNFEKTPAALEAKKAAEAATAESAVFAESQCGGIDDALRTFLAREAYRSALDFLEAETRRHDFPEWAHLLSRRAEDVRTRSFRRLDEIKAEALDRRAKGQEDEVRRLVARVESWGLPALAQRLKADLDAAARPDGVPAPAGAAAPAPVARSAEGRTYLAAWEAAAAKAAVGAFDVALAELKKASAGLAEAALKDEAKADADDLAKAASLRQAVRGRLPSLRRFRAVRLDVRGENGVTPVSGIVLAADAQRVELRSGFVEWSDATTASLAALVRAKEDDARTLAVVALLEGEVEAARAFLEDRADAVPEKYWTWAQGARARIPRPPADELQARGLFHAAEKEYRSAATRAAAIEK
jgi:hypothetical protein